MARAATTSDAFNAVAEPRRREILTYLAVRERPVGDIVTELRIDQPSVSKHLRVLRSVGLVRMRCEGRHKFYRTNAEAIRPLHEWAATFERYWLHQLLNVKKRAEAQMTQEKIGQLNSESEPIDTSGNSDLASPSSGSKEKP
jgi:DNA-binding transcriptional ArsR family regulator